MSGEKFCGGGGGGGGGGTIMPTAPAFDTNSLIVIQSFSAHCQLEMGN